MDTNHNVKSCHVLEEEACQLSKIPVLKLIRWPAMKEDKLWKMFVMGQLNVYCPVEEKRNRLQNVIYEEGKE